MSYQIASSSGVQDDARKNNLKEEEEKTKKAQESVSLFKLFAFADSFDYFLMFFGSVGACIHGASVPVFFIFFGKLIDVIGLAALFPAAASHKVAKVIYFNKNQYISLISTFYNQMIL